MAAAAAAPCGAQHLLPRLGDELPFHTFPRLIRRTRDLLERLIQGQVVPNRILCEVSSV